MEKKAVIYNEDGSITLNSQIKFYNSFSYSNSFFHSKGAVTRFRAAAPDFDCCKI